MLSGILGSLNYFTKRTDDDFIDRLHYFATSNLLVALAILTSFKQFGGKPIECMVPDMFSRAWEQYAENYCFAQDTYFLDFEKLAVPSDDEEKREGQISYYQWVPFFLIFEAACFRLPSLAWKYLASQSGIQIHDLVKVATDPRNVEPDGKQRALESLTIHLQNALRFHRRAVKRRIKPHKYLLFFNLPYSSCYVTFIYFFVKILYLCNVVAQLLLMNTFLGMGPRGSWYGVEAIKNLAAGQTWERTGMFPRVTLCDFKVRAMGSNVQRFSIQCVLTINLFNEKIFIFLWFWYTALLLMTLISTVYWIIIMLIPIFHQWFVARHLELSEMPFNPKESQRDVKKFVSSYLKADGIFILRMITMHAGIIFGTDLILGLYKTFFGLHKEPKRANLLTPSPIFGDDEDSSDKKNPFKFLKFRKKSTDSVRSAESVRKKILVKTRPGKIKPKLLKIIIPKTYDDSDPNMLKPPNPHYVTGYAYQHYMQPPKPPKNLMVHESQGFPNLEVIDFDQSDQTGSGMDYDFSDEECHKKVTV